MLDEAKPSRGVGKQGRVRSKLGLRMGCLIRKPYAHPLFE
jgi:hypothetical protein